MPDAPRPARAPAAASYLSFDVSAKRVGLACGNGFTRSAQPLRTLTEQGEQRLVAIAQVIAEWQPDALVVGVPRHPDGAEHANTQLARRFARRLGQHFRLPVHEVDERYSSTAAREAGARDVDAAAAALLLEQFFHEQPQPTEP